MNVTFCHLSKIYSINTHFHKETAQMEKTNRPTISLARKVKVEGRSLEVRQKHTYRNIWFLFMSIGVSFLGEPQITLCPPPTFQVLNTKILKCIYTLRASFTLQFSIHKMKRQALLNCLPKKYEH